MQKLFRIPTSQSQIFYHKCDWCQRHYNYFTLAGALMIPNTLDYDWLIDNYVDNTIDTLNNHPMPRLQEDQPPRRKKRVDVSKNRYRNIYNLSFKMVQKSVSNGSYYKKIEKLCRRYEWRFGAIHPQEVIDLDKSRKGYLVAYSDIPAYIKNDKGTQHENDVRYILGRYFVWFGRNKFQFEVIRNSKISEENKLIYLKVMTILVEKVSTVLERIDQSDKDQYNLSLGNDRDKYQ